MNCPLCNQNPSNIIWSNESFYIIDVCDPLFPSYLRVISQKHVPEMSSLDKTERMMLWEILNIVENEMIAIFNPDKVNYAQFGNMVPHLHWHIIARWKNDTHFPESPWGKQQRELSTEDYSKQRAKMDQLKYRLVQALNRALGDPSKN